MEYLCYLCWVKFKHMHERTPQPKKSKLKITYSFYIIPIISILLVRWAYSWEGFLTQALTAPVTSILKANHLQSILKTLSSILQSIMFPTFSKLSDLIGRVEAFSIALVLYIISYIVQANAQNYGTFVVSYVFFFIYIKLINTTVRTIFYF